MLPAPRSAAHKKPAACRGCSLADRGHGFVHPDGPEHAPIIIMGEAPGYDEAAVGRPFIGAAGSMLERILRRNKRTRESFRIANVLQCVPPAMLLEKMPYQYTAIDHCKVHRDTILQGGHKVILAAGATPIKTFLGLHGHKRIRVEEFHGTVHWSEEYQKHVVCTFHPSYLQRGAHNLIGTVSFDLQVAIEVAMGQWQPDPIEPVIDPPVDWFAAYTADIIAAARQDPGAVMLAADVETPDKAGGKPENELGPDDVSYQIERWNFAANGQQGVTVPNDPAFLPYVKQLLELECYHLWWNGSGYDWDRMRAAAYNAHPRWQLDLMLAAHILQSDVPLGLGMWAPFYSKHGAWKHLSLSDPSLYACYDGPQTWRTGVGIIGDLVANGQWRAFEEDCHELYHAGLKPAQDVGILIDRPALEQFQHDLHVKQRRLLHEIQGCVPDDLRPLTHETRDPSGDGILHPMARTETLRGEPKKDVADPIKQELYALGAVQVQLRVTRTINVCQTCGAEDVIKRHRCKDEKGRPDKTATPVVIPEERLVPRWFWREPFNPDSSDQMLAYLKFRGHKPGKSKSTKQDSADRETLIRLSKSTKDPFYKFNLDYRAVKKVESTYATPTLRRIEKDPEGRLHPIPTFRPSTGRLSYVSPNITNVVSDKGGKASLAAGFRRCVVAAPGCRLLEVDFSGIEAVESGWWARDPAYIRLARLGVHAYLASHLLGRPADLRWSDGDLLAYFAALKKSDPLPYDKAKRCVHGTNYGLTPYGMANTFPDLYADVQAAEKVQQIYFEVCPTLPAWHTALRRRAYDVGFLGGAGTVFTTPTNACYDKDWTGPSPWPHPFQYRHWFWSVLAYKPITEAQRLRREKAGKACAYINGRWFAVDLGEDSKRVIAFYPQSTASGVLKRSVRQIFCRPDAPSYIGDAYYGRTPFRAPIHDSLLLEVPDRQWDRVCEAVFREMQRPVVEQPMPAEWGMGPHLMIGVEAKAGKNWEAMEKIQVPGWAELGDVGGDYLGVEESDEEDASDFRVVA